MTTPEQPEPLEPLTEDWERALCIVAHPDDMEFGAAAAVARWTGQGKSVGYCMVTSGEAGIDGLSPDECRSVREAEQVASARVVGVSTVEFLGLPDGVLEYGVALRRVLAEVVRRHRPEIVVTGNFRDTWGGRNLNQADHIAVGRAVVDAVRDAGNRWVFAEQARGRAGALGRRTGGVGVRLPRVHPRRRHHRHVRRRRGVAGGARGVHRRAGVGELGPAGVPGGDGARHRVTARRHLRSAVRGVPDGVGRVVLSRAGAPGPVTSLPGRSVPTHRAAPATSAVKGSNGRTASSARSRSACGWSCPTVRCGTTSSYRPS
ncbi:PIG-L deacetylase family protein [Nocardioides convexus]|uniref:PIG-L deacetylase family protein n=1 Tax=Nocardioides convexus TaxID=2712224 RepID=UPI00241879AF|nr:PIG-L deacetylase family protein [Nocardioides convexus]